jgi:hypothetical protein
MPTDGSLKSMSKYNIFFTKAYTNFLTIGPMPSSRSIPQYGCLFDIHIPLSRWWVEFTILATTTQSGMQSGMMGWSIACAICSNVASTLGYEEVIQRV